MVSCPSCAARRQGADAPVGVRLPDGLGAACPSHTSALVAPLWGGHAPRMTRRTAATRHQTTRPALTGELSGDDVLDVLMAFHHPTRRWLAEVLAANGPARVAELASRTGLAAGSVSHHLKLLHRYGIIEPAPELARDTRESWWRSASRTLSWSSEDFEDGTVARRIADCAALANFRHQVRAFQRWRDTASRLPAAWRRLSMVTDSYSLATVERAEDLHRQMTVLILEWTASCREDLAQRPDEARRPVRTVTWVFPSDPLKS